MLHGNFQTLDGLTRQLKQLDVISVAEVIVEVIISCVERFGQPFVLFEESVFKLKVKVTSPGDLTFINQGFDLRP